jgi:hypothetical protein
VSVGVSCMDVCSLQEPDEQLIGPPSDTDPDPDPDPVMVAVSTASPASLSLVSAFPAVLSTVRICPFTRRAAGANCTEMMHEPMGRIR